MGAGILPVAIHQGQLMFLFGSEVYDNKFSDFGGGTEKGEYPFKTAIREGYEELDGFFGNKTQLQELVKENMVFKLVIGKYTVFIFKIPYEPNLPFYFNNHHQFIQKHISHKVNKQGLFEKNKMCWFSLNELKKNRNQFRDFYKTAILDVLISKYSMLLKEAKKV